MDRVKDYVQFAVCFVGLGYIVLWPLTVHDGDMAMLGSAAFCGGPSATLVAFICRPSHALALSPGLHLIGFLSAGAGVLHCRVGRWRRLLRADDGAAQPAKAAHKAVQYD